ncbi:DUF2254 domain-containing protein [Sutcliffiella horikoshii]|uniref:DUF2254 domain-containing protein n=1 Tax=Sutcliffiella horikoshii TaxID=79883 RepID=UPI001F2B3432|nr:DUF2254 domain-containing protein [Sutcliffiella horikoshii]MCG1020263.1 DUF2254 domain-containing protein [Sutcliffiella horikoshii]
MARSASLLRMRTSFWYLPSFYGGLAFLFAIGTLFLDNFILSIQGAESQIPSIFLSDISLSQTILSSIASSLLTMTTITFSTILVVLTTYLSEFSPRALQNFITDHSTQRVLGIFTAGFIYCIILLLFLKETTEEQLFLVPSFAVAIAILCLIVFVFFIQHVTTWIQVSNLLHNITVETMDCMEELFEESDASIHDAPWDDWESQEITTKEPVIIMSKEPGYVQYVDVEALVKEAYESDCIVRVERQQGDYINEHTPILSVWGSGHKIDKDSFRSLITVSIARAPLEDVEFGIRKVTEIGVRALSSGINDPSTAVHCIEQLGTLLSKLTSMQGPQPYFNDKNRNLRVIIKTPDFFDYLDIAFSPILRYGKVDIDVIASIIHVLKIISDHSPTFRKEVIWKYTKHTLESIKEETYYELEKEKLNSNLKELCYSLGHGKEYQKLFIQ